MAAQSPSKKAAQSPPKKKTPAVAGVFFINLTKSPITF